MIDTPASRSRRNTFPTRSIIRNSLRSSCVRARRFDRRPCTGSQPAVPRVSEQTLIERKLSEQTLSEQTLIAGDVRSAEGSARWSVAVVVSAAIAISYLDRQ